MNNSLQCKHMEISAKYKYVKFDMHGTPIDCRIYAWTCNECGEQGTENEEF
jgi:hypothetical protein